MLHRIDWLVRHNAKNCKKGDEMEAQNTRNHLLQVGLRRIHAMGYASTGVKEILDDADAPKGSLYGPTADISGCMVGNLSLEMADHSDSIQSVVIAVETY